MDDEQALTATGAESPYTPFLAAFFRELERRDVRYCVPRNFEDLPERVVGDVDVLVRPGQLRRAEAALENAVPDHFVLRRVERDGHVLIWIGSAAELRSAAREVRAAEVLEVDLVSGLQWEGIAYQDTIAVLSAARCERGIWVASAADMASHVLCHALLDKDRIKPEYRTAIAGVVDELGERAFSPLLPYMGAEQVRALYETFTHGDDAALLAMRGDLVRSLLASQPGAVLGRLAFAIARSLRRLRALLAPPGVLIATAGPDGVGKSTLLANLRIVLEPLFDPVRDQYMGWREFVLPTKRLLLWLQRILRRGHAQGRRVAGAASSTPRTAALPPDPVRVDEPESPTSWTHNFSVLHYFFDLWARYLLQIRPALSRGGLVLCDRYFFDVLVQEVVLCENRWLRALLLSLTPSPTATALLSGDPEVIAARKREMSAQKTARDMAALAVLEGRRGVLDLDAQKPVEENLEAVLRGIFPHWRDAR